MFLYILVTRFNLQSSLIVPLVFSQLKESFSQFFHYTSYSSKTGNNVEFGEYESNSEEAGAPFYIIVIWSKYWSVQIYLSGWGEWPSLSTHRLD